jgi:5-oxopent-3-ene-1,2,5-tricarboxylate decarboxylase/2-hydroxyhepta-2,4-diene-1,7-dioate isomerase
LKTVVGAFLNFRGAWAAMEPAMHREPHSKPPGAGALSQARQHWRTPGQPIVLPPDVDEVEVGAALSIVIGTTAARVSEGNALSHVAGYVVVNGHHRAAHSALRPPIRRNAATASARSVRDRCRFSGRPAALAIRAYVNGELRLENTTAHGAPRAPADRGSHGFMSLAPAMLLVGLPENAARPRLRSRLRRDQARGPTGKPGGTRRRRGMMTARAYGRAIRRHRAWRQRVRRPAVSSKATWCGCRRSEADHFALAPITRITPRNWPPSRPPTAGFLQAQRAGRSCS